MHWRPCPKQRPVHAGQTCRASSGGSLGWQNSTPRKHLPVPAHRHNRPMQHSRAQSRRHVWAARSGTGRHRANRARFPAAVAAAVPFWRHAHTAPESAPWRVRPWRCSYPYPAPRMSLHLACGHLLSFAFPCSIRRCALDAVEPTPVYPLAPNDQGARNMATPPYCAAATAIDRPAAARLPLIVRRRPASAR